MDDDEQHLVVLVRARPLRAEHLVEREVGRCRSVRRSGRTSPRASVERQLGSRRDEGRHRTSEHHPGHRGELLIEWARRAEAGPFSHARGARPGGLRQHRAVHRAVCRGRRHQRVRLATKIAIGPLRARGDARQAGRRRSTRSRTAGSPSASASVRGATTTRRPASTGAPVARRCPSSSPTCAANWTTRASSGARPTRTAGRRRERRGVRPDGALRRRLRARRRPAPGVRLGRQPGAGRVA